jgi:hypothetical protein
MIIGLFMAPPAMAEPLLPIEIHWEAPPGCPQESDVRDRIQKLLGSRRQYSHLRADGTITRSEARFRLDLVVRAGDLVGTRSIESNACEDLAGAAAVELGLLIHSAEAVGKPSQLGTQPPTPSPVGGPEGSSSRSDGTDAHPPQGTSAASPAERSPSGAKAESKTEVESEAKEQPLKVESQRRWRALVQAPLLALSVGPLPRLTIGLGLSLGFEYAKWQWQLKAISWQRQSVPAHDFPGYGADVDRIAADFWACREFHFSWFGFSPCLTVGLERVSASGTGQNVTPSTRHAIGMTAGAGAQGRLYLASWIRLLAAVGGQVELSRPQISIDGVGSVYQFAPAALTVALGLEWIL